jgi:hypothetical protein
MKSCVAGKSEKLDEIKSKYTLDLTAESEFEKLMTAAARYTKKPRC